MKASLLFASLLSVSASAFAQGIPAQPLGLLDKNFAKNTEQSDFFLVRGPGRGGAIVPKLVFSAKVKDLTASGKEQRALFAQKLELEGDPTTQYFLVDRTTPLKKLGTYTVTAGTQFDSFLFAKNTDGDSAKPRFGQVFFHVPGRGLLVSEGGKAPRTVRSENKTDPTTAIISGAVRLSDYRANNTDPELQSRLFFAAKDPKKGREVFIYSGTAAKVLEDIDPLAKMGSDPEEFAVLGPQNTSQNVFFTAKAADGKYQLWRVLLTLDARNRPVYDAEQFTDGSTPANPIAAVVSGKPENLIADESSLFFTAPDAMSGGVPVLFRLEQQSSIDDDDLRSFGNMIDPQQLTITRKDASYSELVFTVNDNGVRHLARYSAFNNTAAILPGGNVGQGVKDPSLITDAGQYFYFAADFEGDAPTTTFLYKLSLANNSIAGIGNGIAGVPFNIREICAVTSDGTAGTLYFTCDYTDGTNTFQNVLMRRPANDASLTCSFVLTPQGNRVVGAKNLRSVIDAGSGIFRLYFTAPVSGTANNEFIPAGSTITDFGTKPFVFAAEGN